MNDMKKNTKLKLLPWSVGEDSLSTRQLELPLCQYDPRPIVQENEDDCTVTCLAMADVRQSVRHVKEILPEIAKGTTPFGLSAALLRHDILSNHIVLSETIPVFLSEPPPDPDAYPSRVDVEAMLASLPPQIRFVILAVDALSTRQDETELHSALFDRITGRVYDPGPMQAEKEWTLHSHMRKFPLYGLTLLLPLSALPAEE